MQRRKKGFIHATYFQSSNQRDRIAFYQPEFSLFAVDDNLSIIPFLRIAQYLVKTGCNTEMYANFRVKLHSSF